MVIWVAVGRGTLLEAILGAFFIRLGESFVQGLIQDSWIFYKVACFLVNYPEGVIGWMAWEASTYKVGVKIYCYISKSRGNKKEGALK